MRRVYDGFWPPGSTNHAFFCTLIESGLADSRAEFSPSAPPYPDFSIVRPRTMSEFFDSQPWGPLDAI